MDDLQFESVEAAIAWAEAVHESELLAHKEKLPAEAIVCRMWKTDRANKRFFGELWAELMKRIVGIGGAFLLSFDEIAKEHVLWKVQQDIFKLITAEGAPQRSKFLGEKFGLAVKRRVLNAGRNHRRSAMGRWGNVIIQDPEAVSDGEEIERPIELASDSRPNQEANIVNAERKDQQRKDYNKALRGIKDPLEREIVRLHFGKGVPIESDHPDTKDLVRRTGKTSDQIRNVLDKGMRIMRKVLARSASAGEAQARQGEASRKARSRKER